MVGEINSMIIYHLMVEGHSVQMESGGRGALWVPSASPGQYHDNNKININNIFGVS